ncbi:hypothetical protein HNP46_000026 [Pseudomonas nitritireducens]|uniref:Uncharacterized protein n=1 Tax=Pseudomonas nitroreducens TaxID=46680 RepID=A0A7W7NZE8_PSENT|nr:hypothetical protein [Pseudomonas nitritireducens]MBB4861215.1 hypothetical protein [Pseudomonas nitritireducens]
MNMEDVPGRPGLTLVATSELLALQESEARLRQEAERPAFGLGRVTPEMNNAMNHAMEELMAMPPEELLALGEKTASQAGYEEMPHPDDDDDANRIFELERLLASANAKIRQLEAGATPVSTQAKMRLARQAAIQRIRDMSFEELRSLAEANAERLQL